MTATTRRKPADKRANSNTQAPSTIVRNAIALMTSTTTASLLGLVFWAAAARFSPPEAVGRASALASSITLLAGFAQLNLADVFLRFLPKAGAASAKFIGRAYAAASGVACLIAVVFVLTGAGSDLIGGFGATVVFVLAVMLFAIFAVQDAVLIALRKATWVPIENIAFSLLKLIVLPLLAYQAGSMGIFAAWTGPVLLTVVIITALIFTRLTVEQTRLSKGVGSLPDRRALTSFMSGQYVASVLGTAVSAAPTILVSHLAGATASAYFYPAWLIGTGPVLLMVNLVMSLVAESSHDATQMSAHIRKTVRLGLIVTLGCGSIMFIGAKPILYAIGGADYAAHGAATLRMIGLALPFVGVLWLFRAFTLITRRSARAALIQAFITATFFACSYIGLKHYGIVGVGTAYLVTMVAATIVSLPWLVPMYRAVANDKVPATAAHDTPTVIAEYFSHRDTMIIPLHGQGRLYSSASRIAGYTVDPDAPTPTELMPLPPFMMDKTQEISVPLTSDAGGSSGMATPAGQREPTPAFASPEGATPGSSPAAGSEALASSTGPVRKHDALRAKPLSRLAPDLVATVLAWTAVALGVLTPLLQLTPAGPFIRIIAIIAFACFGPGAAVVCHIRLGDAASAWTVALILSLSIYASTAVTMVWTDHWHPLPALIVLSTLATASGTLRLIANQRARRALPEIGADPRHPVSSAAPHETVLIPIPLSRHSTRLMESPAAQPTSIIHKVTDRVPPADATVLIPKLAGDAPAPLDSSMVMPVPRGLPHITNAEPPGKQATQPGPKHARVKQNVISSIITHPGWDSTHLALLAGCVTLWLLSLARIDAMSVGDYGLLASVPWTFFAAFALCATGFAFEIVHGAHRRWAMIGYLIIMLLMLHATVPLILHEPEYAWTYKHVAVIEYFQANGSVHDTHEIYQQWPTFFATVAAMVTTAGASPLRLSAWAPLFFDTLNCLPMFAIARSLSKDRRLPYLAVFVFTCANWATQDYLSPQAFAFLLSLGTTLVLLRWIRRVPGSMDKLRPRLLQRSWRWLSADAPRLQYASNRTTQFALAAIYLVYATICSAHQLTPYVFAMDATIMLAFGMLSSWRLIPILGGLAIMYLLPRQNFIDTYGVFDSFNIFKNASGNGQSWATAGQAFSAEVARGLSVFIWGSAIITVLVHRRKMGRVAVPATLAFAPFVLLIQSYGGEAVYRVFLFSVPWCAYLIAMLFLKVKRLPRLALGIAASVLLTVIPLASVQGMHGQLEVNHFSTAEVRASQYMYSHVPDGSAIVLADINFPSPLGPRYNNFMPRDDIVADLIEGGDMLHSAMGPNDLSTIESFVLDQKGTRSFLVISDGMRAYSHYFGRLPDGALDNLDRTLADSPDWRVYFRNSAAVIYEYIGVISSG